jgi:hypothetical protein
MGLLSYNVAVPLLLTYSYVVNRVGGLGLWPAVILHSAFTLWIAACIRHRSIPHGSSAG